MSKEQNLYNDPNFPGRHQGSSIMQLETNAQSWVSTERRFKFQQHTSQELSVIWRASFNPLPQAEQPAPPPIITTTTTDITGLNSDLQSLIALLRQQQKQHHNHRNQTTATPTRTFGGRDVNGHVAILPVLHVDHLGILEELRCGEVMKGENERKR